MKSFALIVLFFGACAAQSYRAERDANEIVIIRSENESSGDGNFRWLSELSDGTKIEQSGSVKDNPEDPENPIQVIQGSYSYTSPEGTLINLKYIADENGFQPEGDHLPTPPPVPEAIQKAIDLILKNADQQVAASQVARQYVSPASPARATPRQFKSIRSVKHFESS